MVSRDTKTAGWREVITPTNSIFSINLSEIWNYRDLLMIWVKRDISSIYKQTILGPLWFFLQPVLTTAVYFIIFSKIANFSTSELPPVLFYLSGIILWGYFAECVIKTSSFLKDNNAIFSKVYFPRLIIPLSIIITNLIKFGIQFILFLIIYIYFLFTAENIQPTIYIFLFPLLILFVAIFGLGAGIIVASLTIKYKDLSHLITFGIQLMMFVSTVFFPSQNMRNESYKKVVLANPMSGYIEAFRYAFSGKGYFDWQLLIYAMAFSVILLITGIILFNTTEKTFVDTI